VDYWLGKILETTAELGLLDNTIIVFASDHGALLGEQGQFVKGADRIRTQVTHVPLLIRLPGKQYAGKRVPGLVQHSDIVPTLLALLNLKGSSLITGEDLWPYITGERTNQRDQVVSGFGYVAYGCVSDLRAEISIQLAFRRVLGPVLLVADRRTRPRPSRGCRIHRPCFGFRVSLFDRFWKTSEQRLDAPLYLGNDLGITGSNIVAFLWIERQVIELRLWQDIVATPTHRSSAVTARIMPSHVQLPLMPASALQIPVIEVK
jgi:Sulfatase